MYERERGWEGRGERDTAAKLWATLDGCCNAGPLVCVAGQKRAQPERALHPGVALFYDARADQTGRQILT